MNTPTLHIALVLTLACIGCNARPLTQLVVVIESSLRAPSELDHVEIDITSPSGAMGRRMQSVGSSADLPTTLGVVHRGGPLGPVRVVVRGRLRGAEVVTREAEVTLQEGRTLRLNLSLDGRCRGVMCRGDQSCAEGSCRARAIAPDELVVFDGTIPGASDAGAADAFSPPTCTTFCPGAPAAAGRCVLGVCRLECMPNRGDCNGVYADGCEVDLRNSASDCGGCGNSCDSDERCRNGACDD